MSEQEEDKQWAVIELMGHVRYGGLVSKDSQFGTAMLRVEVPTNDQMVTQFVNPQSIYRMTICSEEIARAAARSNDHEPLNKWDLKNAGLLMEPETEERFVVEEGADEF